jgi:hypothetical protein
MLKTMSSQNFQGKEVVIFFKFKFTGKGALDPLRPAE